MKMKKSYLVGMMAGLLSLGFGSANAQAEDLSISGDIGVASQYVWRGAVQKGAPAVQGDLGASIGGFSGSVWFSNSYPSPEPQFAGKDVVEFDFTADYSGDIGDSGLSYSVGGIYYSYLYDAHSNFGEAYAGLSFDGPLSPSLTAYYTVKGVKSGFYKTGDLWIDLGVGGSLAGFDLSGALSYVNWKKDIVNRVADQYKNGLSLITLGVSKDVDVSGVTMTPSLTATIPVVKKSADGNRYIYGTNVKNEFIAAVNFSY